MYILRMAAVGAVLMLAACAAAPKMSWVRSDGQSIKNDPVNLQQAQMDSTICQGERDKASLSGVTVTNGGMAGIAASIERNDAAGRVATACMAQKGYVLVPEEQADAKRQELAEIDAERKRRELATAAPVAVAKRR